MTFSVFYAVSNCLIQYDRRVENDARILELKQTIPTLDTCRYSSNYGVQVKEILPCHLFYNGPCLLVFLTIYYIYLAFMTAGVGYRTASGSDIDLYIHGFLGG